MFQSLIRRNRGQVAVDDQSAFESTTFSLSTGSQVCTTNMPGDKFVATLDHAVTGENGAACRLPGCDSVTRATGPSAASRTCPAMSMPLSRP